MAIARYRRDDRVDYHHFQIWQLPSPFDELSHIPARIEGKLLAIFPNHALDKIKASPIAPRGQEAGKNGVLEIVFRRPYQHVPERCLTTIRPSAPDPQRRRQREAER